MECNFFCQWLCPFADFPTPNAPSRAPWTANRTCFPRRRWDALTDRNHCLGFKRFAGRGLRYVLVWRGHWMGLAGWQSGDFKCRPRDRRIGWSRTLQFSCPHLIGNNNRFLIRAAPDVFPNLASHALAAMTQTLSADRQAEYGHPQLLAETFVDLDRFSGSMYQAAGWSCVGRTKGSARSNGRCNDPHCRKKQMYVRRLR
ncbi:MAG: DUF4338 domain-containing protein [Rhodobacteraceae bacterium]|nr:DUF4338 domain-containing protein [Paracoccaceae bacterium]